MADVSKQIAVRLPDDIVDFIDGEVRDHQVASRAAFVQKALERERRRVIAARDAAILSARPGDPEGFDELAARAAAFDTGLE
jgi:Arc/MetJ-type ribon-helix-helix transcriptional regulator